MIYVIEDDQSIREIELYTLQTTGFEAIGFEDGASFFAALKNEKPTLVLLDIMLPDMDGVEILKQLRSSAETENIPIIMASAKGSEFDKIQSLDLGADDYLAKPFGMMEMVSRVRAVLRRTGVSPKETISAGGIEIHPDSHEVYINGERILLTLKEYEILKLLISHPRIVYSREQLLSMIWNIDYAIETRTVDVHIRSLRQKLGNAGKYIDTVRGVGYRFAGDEL